MWLRVGSGPDDGRTVLVADAAFTIGSADGADLRLRGDDSVAPAHAFLKTLSDGRIEIHDLGTEGGTFVNGERLAGALLLLGDEDIRVGETLLTVSLGDPAAGEQQATADDAATPDVERVATQA